MYFIVYFFRKSRSKTHNTYTHLGMACGLSETASKNINVMKVEFGQNFREILANWNICSANWLKTHIYTRMIQSGWSATVSTYTTNLVSAFWHGFYPGYYLSFITGGT